MSESVNGSADSYQVTETGTLTTTGSDTGNSVQGTYTRSQQGSDAYNLSETGTANGGYTESIQGSDTYILTQSGDTPNQTFSRTLTGSGTYTLQDSGPGATLTSGSGSCAYSLQESGSWRGGSLSQTETGSDRYSLLQDFANVSNAANGTPGHLDFSPVGLPFTDPPLARPAQPGGGGIDPGFSRFIDGEAIDPGFSRTLPGAGVSPEALRNPQLRLLADEGEGRGPGRPRGPATDRNFRQRWKESVPGLDGMTQEELRQIPGNHTIPRKFEKLFAEAGINIHEPQWIAGMTPEMHAVYDQAFDAWIAKEARAARVSEEEFLKTVSVDKVLKQRKFLMKEFKDVMITSKMTRAEVQQVLRNSGASLTQVERRGRAAAAKAAQVQKAMDPDFLKNIRRGATGLAVLAAIGQFIETAKAANDPATQALLDDVVTRYSKILNTVGRGGAVSTKEWWDLVAAMEKYGQAIGVSDIVLGLIHAGAAAQFGDPNENIFYPPGRPKVPPADNPEGQAPGQVQWGNLEVWRKYMVQRLVPGQVVSPERYAVFTKYVQDYKDVWVQQLKAQYQAAGRPMTQIEEWLLRGLVNAAVDQMVQAHLAQLSPQEQEQLTGICWEWQQYEVWRRVRRLENLPPRGGAGADQ
jgi:hypothetical protein